MTFIEWLITSSVSAAILGALVVVAGWRRTHNLTSARDKKNREDAIVIAYLTEAFEALAHAGNREPTAETDRLLETSLAKIQLLGDAADIGLAHKALDEWAQRHPDGRPRMSLDPLLISLRNSLRARVSLPPESRPVRWLRVAGGLR